MPPEDYIPRRIVSLQPSITLTLRDLGRLDRVVACTRYCADVCPEVSDGTRLIVSDSWSAQSAEILAAEPDLVIAAVPYQLESVAEILKSGIRFLAFAPRSLADIYADISLLAGVLHATAEGSATVDRIRQAVLEIREQTSRLPGNPRVFCEEWGKPIIASQPWVAELITAAGGKFLGIPGKSATPDEVAAYNPDLLIAAWCGAGDRVPLERLVDQRNWSEIPAVRNHRVFCIRDELLNTPASNLIDGLRALAWALHPGQFPRPAGIRQISAM